MQTKGYTLIELMLVVAIIAIVASIGYPAYTESVQKTKRSHARDGLMELAQAMERFHNETGSYKNADVATLVGSTNAPLHSDDHNYTLSIEGKNDVKYLLKATRAGSMTDDACGDFTYNSAGQFALTGSPTKTVADCWKR